MQHAPRKSPVTTQPVARVADPAADLRDLLSSLLTEHETLAVLLQEQREAIRRADPDSLGSIAERHTRTLTRIADLESSRADLVRSWPLPATRTPGRPLTLRDLARALPEPGRTDCLTLASRLRDALDSTKTAAGILRTASSSLLAHMEGLMRQVGRRLSHAGTYGRTGEVEPVAAVVSALDLTR